MDRRDWENAYRLLIAEGRERLGGLPTEEEIFDLMHGNLSAEETAQLLERISHYPELARILATPFEEPAEPTEHPAQHAAFWKTATLVAAALAVTFGFLLVRAGKRLTDVSRHSKEPQANIENVVFSVDPDRGTTPAERRISSRADYFLMMPVINNEPSYSDYRVDLLDASATPPRVVWSRTGIRRRSDNSFEIMIPRSFLQEGKYQLAVQGMTSSASTELARFSFRYEPSDAP